MNQYRIMNAPLVRPATMMMRPPLHPNTPRRANHSQHRHHHQQRQQMEEATTKQHSDSSDLNNMVSFLRITLGFFPSFVNRTKRVSDQAEWTTTTTTLSEEEEEEEATALQAAAVKEEEEEEQQRNSLAPYQEEEEEAKAVCEQLAADDDNDGEEEEQSTSPYPVIGDVNNASGGTNNNADGFRHIPDLELSDISDSEIGEMIDFSNSGDNSLSDITWKSDTTSFWSIDPEYINVMDMMERHFSRWIDTRAEQNSNWYDDDAEEKVEKL